MRPFFLSEVTTEDQLILQGIFYKPKKSNKRALLWVHGLTSNFYGDIDFLNLIADSCEKTGHGFAIFNNRGHDFISGGKRLDNTNPKGYSHLTIGAGNENFSDCVFDIDAGIDFLVRQGFKEIVLIGHSTGAGKACYYSGLKSGYIEPDISIPHVNPAQIKIYNNLYKKYVIGSILASPVSDRLDPSIDKNMLQTNLIRMMNLVNDNKGDELINNVFFFPITPRRFLSLFVPNSLEDQFDYGDSHPRLTYFSQIEKPLMVILGENDEYIDRPAKNIKTVFDHNQRSSNYKSIIISNASHGFDGKEKEVIKSIIEWLKSIK